jgi:multidrug efflux pump
VSISQPFIERPIATSLLTLGVLMLGVLGYRSLPIAALPSVDFPTIQVSVALPGASPETLASSVTTPLEHAFGQIAALSAMTSTSSFGTASITLQFELTRDIDAAAQDVQAAISASAGQLQKGLPNPPVYSKVNPADTPVLILAVTSDSLPLRRVNDFADNVLAQKLSQVEGVGLVTIEGGQKPAVRIQVNPAAIAALGLSLEDVRAVIGTANVDLPKGNLDGPRQAFAIGADDQILSADSYANLIVAYKNGSPVRLGDIGSVIDSVENSKLAGWYNDKPAVILDVRRQPGANIITTVDKIRELLPRLKASLPPAIKLDILTDRTETIRASIREVQFTLVLTVGLVVLVIFLFLRKFWATVIPSVTLPVSLVATFGVMQLVGFSLDNLSLMALTIAAGFVVDDAIVMIENIVRHIEAGETPIAAASKGAKQIGFTIVSLTVSLVAVFIPLLFMGGIVGRLFREFAITLSVAVITSAFVSLTLTPMMCAQLLRRGGARQPGRVFMASERVFAGLLELYRRSLRFVLRHRPTTLVITAATLVATIYLYIAVPKGFLPQQDTGLIVGVTDAAQDISFPAMVARQREVADIALADPAVASVGSFVGAGTVNAAGNSGRLYINLKPKRDRDSSAESVISRLRRNMTQIHGVTLFMQAVQDVQIDSRISRTQYQYTLQDADPVELTQWAPRLLAELRRAPELRDVATDQQSEGLQAALRINRDDASRLGVALQAIDDTLYDAFGQRQVSTIFTQLNQYRVILEVDPRFQLDPSALDTLYVKSSTGQQVPLSALAKVEQLNAPLSINHLGMFPAVTLSFNVTRDASLGAALQAIERAETTIGLPDTVAASFSGSAAEFRASLASEPWLILAAIIVVYIVLGVLYESYIHPVTILSTLPSAGAGALLALMLCGYELTIISLIGIILLIGIVKKNAIMMIDFALDAERNEGMAPEEAIFAASMLRFRPIMMTTMAALLGALPLALQSGSGSELRRPLGIAILGGLVISQFLTLYTTPVIYLGFSRMTRWLAGAPATQPTLPANTTPITAAKGRRRAAG